MNEQASLLSRLTRAVAETAPEEPLTVRLCLALAEIAGLDGGSMTIGYTAPSRTMLCATDPVAERIEELQDLAREGPALDAHRLADVVEVTEGEIDQRWPILGQAFPDGVLPARVVAAPMRPHADVLGVVTLHGGATSALAVSTDEIQFLANAIGVAVLGGFERSEGTDELWLARDLLNQATGMVVAQLGVNPADALAVLRAHAFAHETSLADIANEVVQRSLIFLPGPATGPDAMDEADDD